MIKIEPLKAAWSQLSLREQRALFIGAIFLLSLLFYGMIIQPIFHAINNQTQMLQNQKKLYQWMQTTVPQLLSLRNTNSHQQPIPAGSLLSFVEKSLKQARLSEVATTLEKNTEQSGNESVQLKFDKISFDQCMTWLIAFWQTYAVEISQLSVTRTPEAGVVQVNIILNI